MHPCLVHRNLLAVAGSAPHPYPSRSARAQEHPSVPAERSAGRPAAGTAIPRLTRRCAARVPPIRVLTRGSREAAYESGGGAGSGDVQAAGTRTLPGEPAEARESPGREVWAAPDEPRRVSPRPADARPARCWSRPSTTAIASAGATGRRQCFGHLYEGAQQISGNRGSVHRAGLTGNAPRLMARPQQSQSSEVSRFCQQYTEPRLFHRPSPTDHDPLRSMIRHRR